MSFLPASADAEFDLLCIGNAIVDVLAPVDAGVPEAEGLVPGSMTLIDAQRADALYGRLEPEQQTGGGSAANTAVAASLLGARTAYLGTVAADALGLAYADDLRRAGIFYPTAPLDAERAGGHSTARCMILVTPDGQRTMSTYLGACTAFGPADLDERAVARSRMLYLEGYLFDPPAAQDAFRRAAEIAHDAGRKVALSLSDPFCVGRHRAAFRALAAGHVDILFANEDEILSLYEAADFGQAAAAAARDVELAVLTRGEKGSVVFCRGERTDIAAQPTTLRDSTGAGDAYAAGFLFGLARGLAIAECGRIGAVAASEVISHFGARPEGDLRALAGV
ncbi:adenosine kinase [Acetobacteraceae bacterium KSS8]|uniref:Adenosine kinase n=1 Tax=Endosaccharibacter trunci TaxID=2812733 RepID=A0ABT1WAI2_9PROT|nr:adenosine kinase [Acetobacteraceae bacterium KSS8]